jgi:hypothetical protein
VIGNFYITSDLIPPLTSFFTWSHFESLTLRVIFSNLYGIISHPSPDKNILFLIQFKFKEKAKLDGEDQLKISPQKWISQMKNVEQLKELKDFKLIFVYITNANK